MPTQRIYFIGWVSNMAIICVLAHIPTTLEHSTKLCLLASLRGFESCFLLEHIWQVCRVQLGCLPPSVFLGPSLRTTLPSLANTVIFCFPA